MLLPSACQRLSAASGKKLDNKPIHMCVILPQAKQEDARSTEPPLSDICTSTVRAFPQH